MITWSHRRPIPMSLYNRSKNSHILNNCTNIRKLVRLFLQHRHSRRQHLSLIQPNVRPDSARRSVYNALCMCVWVNVCLVVPTKLKYIYIYICTEYISCTCNSSITVDTARFLNDSRRQSTRIKSTKLFSVN